MSELLCICTASSERALEDIKTSESTVSGHLNLAEYLTGRFLVERCWKTVVEVAICQEVLTNSSVR